MKEKLIRNAGLKILALLVAFLIWFVVTNVDNPVRTQVFNNVPVTVTHTELVTNPGNTFQVSENTRSVSVTVRARQRDLAEIRTENIRATADMINLVSRSLIPIDVTIPGYNYVDASASPKNIQITIEANKTSTYPIVPTTSGTLRDGYVLGSLQADPERIEISGPESVVDSIDRVVAEVDVSGLSKDTELPATMVLYDANNKIIDSTLIEHNLGEEGLMVKVSLLQTKSVAVDFDTSLVEAAAGYRFSGITVQPEKISIVGTKEQLKDIKQIEVPASVLARQNLTKTTEVSVDITEYLPSWAKPEDEAAGTPVLVTLIIEQLGTRTIPFPINSISVVNVAQDLRVINSPTENLDIIITGESEEALAAVNLEQGDVSINLVNYKEPGDYQVPVQVILPEGISLVGDLTVHITLEKNNGGSDG